MAPKSKPYSTDHLKEFDVLTKDLSIAARGIWISLRVLLGSRNEYAFDGPVEVLAWVIRCPTNILRESIEEFQLRSCGFRIEWPPGTSDVMPHVSCSVMRVVWEPGEKTALSLSLNSVRVSKHRNSIKDKELRRMPENYELTEKMKNFALKHGMTNATVMHEFERYKMHHNEAEWTEKGWEILVWSRWVLNWISYGRRQVNANGVDIPKSMVDLL